MEPNTIVQFICEVGVILVFFWFFIVVTKHSINISKPIYQKRCKRCNEKIE